MKNSIALMVAVPALYNAALLVCNELVCTCRVSDVIIRAVLLVTD